jgi:secreted trypsin-like serine protease
VLLFGATSIIEAGRPSLRATNVPSEQKSVSVTPPTNRNLIIGGNIGTPGDYPYFAHLEGISCGGSLIAPDIVLTAGHVRDFCFRSKKNIFCWLLLP